MFTRRCIFYYYTFSLQSYNSNEYEKSGTPSGIPLLNISCFLLFCCSFCALFDGILSIFVFRIQLEQLLPVWFGLFKVLLVVVVDEAHVLISLLQVADFVSVTLLCLKLLDYFLICWDSHIIQLALECSVTFL